MSMDFCKETFTKYRNKHTCQLAKVTLLLIFRKSWKLYIRRSQLWSNQMLINMKTNSLVKSIQAYCGSSTQGEREIKQESCLMYGVVYNFSNHYPGEEFQTGVSRQRTGSRSHWKEKWYFANSGYKLLRHPFNSARSSGKQLQRFSPVRESGSEIWTSGGKVIIR